MGIEHPAEDVTRLADERDESPLADHDAREEVVVAAQVFRARMKDEIRALLQRPLVHGRRERRVDQDLHPRMTALRLRERRQIDDAQIRIGRRLGQDDARARADGGGEHARLAGGDERALHAEARERLRHERARSPVAIADEHHVIALLQQREERRGDGGHAAAEERSVLAGIERSELQLRRAHRGVAIAAIFLALGTTFEVVTELGAATERVRRGARDGRGHGIERVLAWLTGADGEGVETTRGLGPGNG